MLDRSEASPRAGDSKQEWDVSAKPRWHRTLLVLASVALLSLALPFLPLDPSLTWPASLQVAVHVDMAAMAVVVALSTWSTRQDKAFSFALIGLALLAVALLEAVRLGMLPSLGQNGRDRIILQTVGNCAAVVALWLAARGPLRPWWPRRLRLGSTRAGAEVLADSVQEERARYRQLFNNAPDGLLLVDEAGAIVQANPAAAAIFGWSMSELIGLPVDQLLPRRLRDRHQQLRAGFQAEPRTREMGRGLQLEAERRDGRAVPVEVALVPQTIGNGRSTLCIVRDVTERRRLERTLIRQAMHDAMTELPNRRYFSIRIGKALAHAERQGGTLAVLFIDLDNFKVINDTLGHTHGDEVVRQVSRRLNETVRAGDLLARMGGDEFALLLVDAEVQDAAAAAARVLCVMEPPFVHAEQTMKVGASIGIAMYPADGRSVGELLSHADLAMYRAKQRGRNSWCFFERGMTERLRERSSMQRDLEHALERGQFEVVFQPRVMAQSGKLTGFEALLRWRHPVRGNVPPDVFIALAEENGWIVPIGEWVLRESCAQASRWRDKGTGDFTMAVNVSTYQLRDAQFAERVQQVLVETGWPAHQLELEITETALMQDPRESAELLERITRLGVRLAVDDFGTGYSSLAYLKSFPLHRLKVDRSFVQGLHTNESDRVIAASIIALAHALGLQVTAEGVETADQRDYLVQRQCDELQGYLFSAPMSSAKCEAWLPLPSLLAPPTPAQEGRRQADTLMGEEVRHG